MDPGQVDGVKVTTSATTPASATFAVNTPATFTATATAGTPTYYTGWSYNGPAVYKWTVTSPGTVSSITSPTTTVTVLSSAAGTFPVTVSCQVSYSCINDDEVTEDMSGNASASVTVYVIGGPVDPTKSDNNIYWFCDSSSYGDWGHMSAASGQPAGTTYSWSLTGTGAQFLAGTTSATATYCGAGAGSSSVGDVKATVTYSLSGVTATSDPWSITVHAPMYFVLKNPSTDAYTKYEGPGPDDVWGFDAEHLYFTIWDGLKQPMRSSQHQAYWTEKWDLTKDSNGHDGNGPVPSQIGDALDDTGSHFDTFSRYPVPQPTNANGDKTVVPMTHSYYMTDQGGGGAGPTVGCPVKVYTNVAYNTFGVVGNGLPEPTK